MNRNITNTIRFVMDEMIPPVIRDSKWFMYPFYYIWFKGKHIKEIMNFKRDVYFMSEQEFSDFYKKRDSIAKDRPTDLSEISIDYMIKHLAENTDSFLDVGCGNGYLLNKIQKLGIKTTGCDVFDESPFEHSAYVQGNIEKMPIEDNAYDVVSACHTLEHVLGLNKSIEEIKRVAKKQVMVVVPCQRFFYYSLDEHVNFFPIKEKLIYYMGMEKYLCEVIKGDIVYIGYKD